MNLEQSQNHVRDVWHVSLVPIRDKLIYKDMKVFEFRIKSRAFLWHQIRCIMAVLFLIGRKLEAPEVISDLLDIGKTSAKPMYQIASEVKLLLLFKITII